MEVLFAKAAHGNPGSGQSAAPSLGQIPAKQRHRKEKEHPGGQHSKTNAGSELYSLAENYRESKCAVQKTG